jgi:anti-sigma regulatory factor (Ser/Thr protein kinase)
VTEFEIAGGARAPCSARDRLSEVLDARLGKPLIDNVRLLVSELVTNCVLHGGAGDDGTIRVSSRVGQECVRTEVCHDGPSFLPPADAPDIETPGGLGLFLVEQMSTAWGVGGDGQTCVWFELGLTG